LVVYTRWLAACKRSSYWQSNAVNVERIKERLANGFRPFQLHLSNDRRVPVLHPDFVAIGKGTIVVMDDKDSVSIIDALHIVSIDDLPTAK
jgi:hypothetical protein